MKHNVKDLERRLITLMEREKTVLLSGDLRALQDFEAEKQSLADELESQKSKLDKSARDRLLAFATENERLYSSALQGLRSVINRLSEIKSVSEELKAYEANGKMASHKAPISSMEKRA
ncbi:hypothetical protein [Litoreibacter roseus]|uniref:FlgN protein n=1 Tax=Litoreibacter roseus TaxID=2601869 RepID=A0A6N6JDJ1_9RHOB|nr:hypothetical protein [Litoreibacter roseus]GFE64421.1 hypothetical protein KIN_14950 [Litoreibacter roseus]